MKLPLLSIAAVLVLIEPATAVTNEQLAVGFGQIRGGYERARFICLADGFPMETFEKHHAKDLKFYEDAKVKYPDFWALGVQRGIALTNTILADRDLRPQMCKNSGW